MSDDALPRAPWRAARLRDGAIVAAFALPWTIALAVAAARAGGMGSALAVAALVLVAAAGVAAWRWRRRDARWLQRTLDAQRPDMEDSADLLLPGAARSALQRRQRERLRERLGSRPPDLRAPWPRVGLLASASAAALVLAAALAWPPRAAMAPGTGTPLAASADTVPGLAVQELRIEPPSYTRLPPRIGRALSARAPQGSALSWRFRFASTPARVALVFAGGRRLEVRRAGDDWVARHRLDASALYRLEVDGRVLGERPYRLDALPDRPPQVRVVEPLQASSLATPGQARWRLRFEATDDHGVQGGATLRLTTAKGGGENVAFQQRERLVAGSGPAVRRRFAVDIDLAALGLAAGDEVVARLAVRDARGQEARSPSVILRLPAAAVVQGSDLEASIKKVLPAYFRSQRQIIMDAEALLKQRRTLAAETFVKRSDAIGVDQRILRLRYGQFLGEESEGGARPLPTNDGDTGAPADSTDGHADEHDEGTAAADPPATFGNAGDLLSAYGHTHDQAEAATLLDPDTRATLKLALDQMWQSEGELRQGAPERALPHAYKALGYIKQVQQAERIYLARVGPELPPIDEARRMTGKRDGLASRALVLSPATRDDAGLVAAWRALEDAPGNGATVDFAALGRWLRAHPARVSDPLAVEAAIDTLQRSPGCERCRAALRAQLWPLLARPPAVVPRRAAADAQGRRYLDALERSR